MVTAEAEPKVAVDRAAILVSRDMMFLQAARQLNWSLAEGSDRTATGQGCGRVVQRGLPNMAQDNNPLDQLCGVLAALGQTPGQVAEVLRASGCRGYRLGYIPSPVIRFAYRRFDEGSLVLVYAAPGKPDRLYLYNHQGVREELPLPAPVANFLAKFDEGMYPDLDLESVRGSA